MISVQAKIVGMPRLLRKLKVLPDAARAEIRIELGKVADDIVAMMQSLAPEVSGDLRKSIGWTWGDRVPKGAMAIATAGKGDLAITIFAGDEKAYYARWVEFGTVKMSARPYFYVAWRAGKRAARKQLREASRRAARRVAGLA